MQSEQWQKTVVSDQLIDRLQESADKKKRIAERQTRIGDSTEEEILQVKPIGNTKLLMQQLQYDNEMEEQVTVQEQMRESQSQFGVHSKLMLGSQISEVTKVNGQASGLYEDYKEINVGRFDFAASPRDQSQL